jgi:hypothetical protein
MMYSLCQAHTKYRAVNGGAGAGAAQVSERARRRLFAAVERAKCTLSVVTSADIEVQTRVTDKSRTRSRV